MSTTIDSVNTEVSLNSVPRDLCWGTPEEFLQLLTKILSVRLNKRGELNFVLIGSQTPGPDDVDKIWFKKDKSGNFEGIFGFTKGAWRKLYTSLRSDMIIWMYGRSDSIPDGFQLIDGNAGISSSIINHVMSFYKETASDPGIFSYFAVRFVGY